MEECEEFVFDVLVPEVKRVTLALTLVAKSATKFKIKYSIGHDLLSLHSYNDPTTNSASKVGDVL